MKRTLAPILFVLLSCLNSPAPTYSVPIFGNGFQLQGSQFIVGEMTSTYDGNPSGASNNDLVLNWNCALQDFDPVVPTYVASSQTWVPDASLPLGTAFVYVGTVQTFLTRTVIPVIPTLLTALPCPCNNWFTLSSQTPDPNPAKFGDLIGQNPGTDCALSGPFSGTQVRVMTWDVPLQDFNYMYGRVGFGGCSGAWRRLELATGLITALPPTIPQFGGAFVTKFCAPCGPISLQSVQVSGCCPPDVTLTLTFSGPVDPVRAALPSSYSIPNAIITSAKPLRSLPPPTILPVFNGAELKVKLQTKCGNTYTVSAPAVRCNGNTPVAGSQTFSLDPLCGSPPINNTYDTPATLVSGVAVSGSLMLANCTPLGVVNAFPSGSGAIAKDVWYQFTPPSFGQVEIDLCQSLTTPCPNNTDTTLAIYTGSVGSPAALDFLTTGVTYTQNDSLCGANPQAAKAIISKASHCTAYYIRVSGKNTGNLPGDFRLLLTHTPTAPANDDCSFFTPVSPNSSTPFDTSSATTGSQGLEPIQNDVWFRFRAPPGVGPHPTTIETSGATFNTYLAVYASPCPGSSTPALVSQIGAPQSSVTFSATAGAFYFVRLGGPTSGDKGCGFLRVASGIPATGTPPGTPCSGVTGCKTYRILGLPTGTPWTWSLSAPPQCAGDPGFNVQGTAGPVAPGPGITTLTLANAFATSITQPGLTATASPTIPARPDAAILTICGAFSLNQLVLKVGPSAGSPNCWVNAAALPVAIAPCNFNPEIVEIGSLDGEDADCNTNGVADYADIYTGTSSDVDNDGVPDECQACVPVQVESLAESASTGIGGYLSVPVVAVGSGPFTYQWRKEGVPLAGQTGSSLLLTNVVLESAGAYDVIVSNACGNATSPTLAVVVDERPVLFIERSGTDVQLSWSASEFQLQMNTTVTNAANWITIPGASPITLPPLGAAQFFRLTDTP